MVIQITTWSPDTCKCEFSYTWDDEEPQDQRVHTFYAVHNVCDAHMHLATQEHHLSKSADRDLHTVKGQTKMRHIHAVTERNITRHQERFDKETRRRVRRELDGLLPLVHQHNQQVKQDFEDIFTEPFVHDEHVYLAVLTENQNKNIQIGKIQEKHGPDTQVDYEFDNARRLTLKVHKDIVDSVQGLVGKHVTIQAQELDK